jgi:hypothetical protein
VRRLGESQSGGGPRSTTGARLNPGAKVTDPGMRSNGSTRPAVYAWVLSSRYYFLREQAHAGTASVVADRSLDTEDDKNPSA